MHRVVVVLSLLVPLLSCKGARDAEKAAAKERFLTGQVAAPLERGVPIDPAKAARDPVEMEKAQLLGSSAVAARLGSFRFAGSTEYRATRGKRQVRLSEKLQWHQGPKGEFHTLEENSRGHGVETWWTGSKFYLRRRFGTARERPVEGREYLEFRDAVWSAWAAAYRIFKGQLRFTEAESVELGGRRATRFEIALSEGPLTHIAETLKPQPEKIDLGDLKVATASRRSWRRAARPVAAHGTLDLDAQSAVPLAVDFRGRLQLRDEEAPAELAVRVQFRIDAVGSAPAVGPPEGAELEPVMRKVDSRRFDLLDMVRIEDFLIDKWEFPNERGAAPRTGVTWREARAACQKAGKRLCSLKEWQKACNSDRRRNRYPYGAIYRPERCHTEGEGPLALGERRDCRGEFEVFDLTGNVGEWVVSKGKDDRLEWCVAGGAFDDRDKARCTRCVPREEIGEPDARVGFRCCR